MICIVNENVENENPQWENDFIQFTICFDAKLPFSFRDNHRKTCRALESDALDPVKKCVRFTFLPEIQIFIFLLIISLYASVLPLYNT